MRATPVHSRSRSGSSLRLDVTPLDWHAFMRARARACARDAGTERVCVGRQRSEGSKPRPDEVWTPSYQQSGGQPPREPARETRQFHPRMIRPTGGGRTDLWLSCWTVAATEQPVVARIARPVRSQRRTVRSTDPVTIRLPSGDQSAHVTEPICHGAPNNGMHLTALRAAGDAGSVGRTGSE